MDIPHLVVGLGSLIAGISELKKGVGDFPSLGFSDGKSLSIPSPDDISRGSKGKYKATIKNIGDIDGRVKYVISTIQKGRKDPRVRAFAVKAVSKKCGGKWCVPERNWWGEVKAVFGAIRDNVRYVRDIHNVDTFQAPNRTLEFGGGDCFAEGTLLLKDDYTLVQVEDVRPGMKIWGYDRFSTVTNWWSKGILPVTSIELNNGSKMMLTEDHKIYVADCEHHDLSRKSGPCHCKISERTIKRIKVSELKEGMVLLQPTKIDSFDKNDTSKSIAFAELAGLYLSDGWIDGYRIAIAGKDGFPKEKQKQRVQELADVLGFNSSSNDRYARVYGKSLVESFSEYGSRAYNKHLPNLRYSYDEARVLLNGILADSSKHTLNPSTRTLTSTSKTLAIQARILHKIFGINCSESYIENHGGLGKHPIWRISSREENSKKLLRVKRITRDVANVSTYDISTDDHYVYLPEADVTVSNCDDYTITLGSALQSIGFPIKVRIVQSKDSTDYNHIFLLVGIPPRGPRGWYSLDASIDKHPGWHPPRGMLKKIKDYDVP